MGTYTPNLDLYRPTFLETGYDDEFAASMDILDRFAHNPTAQYVDAEVVSGGIGVNTNNGKSPATPVADIVTAYDNLGSQGGYIFLMSVNAAQPKWDVNGKGLWIVGPNDSRYASPLPNWRVQKPVTIVGVGTSNNAHGPGQPEAPTLVWGASKTDREVPAIWISGTNVPITFRNVATEGLATAARIGLDSADGTTNRNTSGVKFQDCLLAVNTDFRAGPTVDIGYGFWVRFLNSIISGNASSDTVTGVSLLSATTYRFTVNHAHSLAVGETVLVASCSPSGYNGTWTITNVNSATTFDADIGSNPGAFVSGGTSKPLMADRRAAIRASATGVEDNPGLITLRDVVFSNGGVRYKPHGGTSWGGVTLEDVLMEGDFVSEQPPTFHLVAPTTGPLAETNTGLIRLKTVSAADGVWSSGVVRTVGAVTSPTQVVVETSNGVEGPATIIGSTVDTLAGQIGFFHGDRGGDRKVHGQHDGHVRSFHPPVVRFINRAAQDVSTWTGFSGSATVTTGRTAPDGTTQAAKLTSSSGSQTRRVASSSLTVAVGDFFLFGGWVKGTFPNTGSSWPFQFAFSNASFRILQSNNSYYNPPMERRTDGDWQYVSRLLKVSVISTNPVDCILDLQVLNGFPLDFYMPFMVSIPTGTMTEAEAYEYADAFATYPDGAPVGSLTTNRGQKLLARGGLGVGNAVAASESIGKAVTKKIQVFDETGASLGYVPVYSSIT